MSNAELVMVVGGLIAIVLGAVNILRSSTVSTTDAAIIVLGAVFVILAFL
jgi:hypothetical protein